MPSLVVTELDAGKRALLEKWGVRDFRVLDINGRDELRLLPAEKLRALFRFASSGAVHLQQLLFNLIWQGYTRIKSVKREGVQGNIRSFWYQDVKAPLSRLGLLQRDPESLAAMMRGSGVFTEEECAWNDEETFLAESDEDGVHPKSEAYLCQQMTNAFDKFVTNHVFTFWEFGIFDDEVNNRFIGTKRPEVIFAAEKRGFVGFAKEMHGTHGISALCLGGHPKYITSQYFAEDLSRVMDPVSKEVLILACTDYDPDGAMISGEFVKQLEFFGVPRVRVMNLITPDVLPADRVEDYKYKIAVNTSTRDTIIREWVEKTGGINGEPYGLESDVVPRALIRERVAAMLRVAR